MRIVLDYRSALRQRTGVGEFVHELARALAAVVRPPTGHRLAIVTTSWRDRPAASVAEELPGVELIHWRIPVRALTWMWNRAGWPAVEWLAGAADVVHSATPLLIPATHAAQVITVHDLDFLRHPERVRAEMRRDFPALVRAHAARADHVIAVSPYAAREAARELGIAPDRIAICPLGAPRWAAAVARQRATGAGGRHILFLGTIEPRKNLGTLLDAYSLLRSRRPEIGPLVLAGLLTSSAQPWVERANREDLRGRVEFRGYVTDEQRQQLYRDAHLLVLPSFEEGFGLPVLEAMACGVPVVVSNRGALPELVGPAAEPVEPEDAGALASAMEQSLDRDRARLAISHGFAQAARFTWEACARAALDAYRAAISAHARRLG